MCSTAKTAWYFCKKRSSLLELVLQQLSWRFVVYSTILAEVYKLFLYSIAPGEAISSTPPGVVIMENLAYRMEFCDDRNDDVTAALVFLHLYGHWSAVQFSKQCQSVWYLRLYYNKSD